MGSRPPFTNVPAQSSFFSQSPLRLHFFLDRSSSARTFSFGDNLYTCHAILPEVLMPVFFQRPPSIRRPLRQLRVPSTDALPVPPLPCYAHYCCRSFALRPIFSSRCRALRGTVFSPFRGESRPCPCMTKGSRLLTSRDFFPARSVETFCFFFVRRRMAFLFSGK